MEYFGLTLKACSYYSNSAATSVAMGDRSFHFCLLHTVIANVIEIEGLLFLVFGQVLANVRAPWKTGFSHQVTSRGSSKMELFS